MDIEMKRIDINSLYVIAAGRLDLDNAVEYGTLIKDTMEDADEDILSLTLDFKNISFISSFGLKVVLELYKHMQEKNGSLKLLNVSDTIKNSFISKNFYL